MKLKRGISPIIATILLIALVVIIGIIVFFWFRGLTQEAIVKFDKNIKLVCEDVSFESSYSDGTLFISNLGNVPIYDFDVKVESQTTSRLDELGSIAFDWPRNGLYQGGVFSGSISITGNDEKITLIPVLRGLNEDGIEKTESCEERHGKEIFL